jgi:hypothetical protein
MKTEKIICHNPGCTNTFSPRKQNHHFCSRKCFKKEYYYRKKAEELANKKFPVFTCPSCDTEITLDFDPVKESIRWLNFLCPHCNVLMINVSDSIITKEETKE